MDFWLDLESKLARKYYKGEGEKGEQNSLFSLYNLGF